MHEGKEARPDRQMAGSWARTSRSTEAYATIIVYKQIASFLVSDCRFSVSPVNYPDPEQKI